MSDPVKLGVIGCGVIGGFHLEAAAEYDGVELAAVADVDRAKSEQRAEEFGVAKTYTNGSELLADDDIEAVVLALPTGVRTPLAFEALDCGKHVLLEKPAACCADEVRRMIELRGDRVVGVCSARYCFTDSAKAARKIVASGELGPIRVVRCRGLLGLKPIDKERIPPPWRVSHKLNGGGFLVNWGVYDLNYLLEIIDWQLKPNTVLAATWPIAPHLAAGRNDPNSDAENHVTAFILCDNGAVITFERGETMAMPEHNAWEITGERGSLRLRMLPTGDDPFVIHDTTDSQTGLSSQAVLTDPGPDVAHRMPVRDLAQAIRTRSQPMTTLEKALIIQQIVDAIYESARAGAAVKIA